MNEQQNTDFVQKLYDCFRRGEIQTILDHLTDDVDWSFEGPAIIPFAGKRKGPAQVRGFFDGLGSTLRDMKLTISDYVAQGDRVATTGRFAATVSETGKSFDVPIAHFFTVRNGKVSKLIDLTDTAAQAEVYTKTTAASR